MEYLAIFVASGVTGCAYLFMYYLVKIRYIEKLKIFFIFTNAILLFFIIYPILSTKIWNSDLWAMCVAAEVGIIILYFTTFRRDYQQKRIYEIINQDQLITIIGGRPFGVEENQIEDIRKKLESLLVIPDKYVIPFNIVFIGNRHNVRKTIEFTFVFWKMIDYNKFIQSNPNLEIEEISRSKSGICLNTVISLY